MFSRVPLTLFFPMFLLDPPENIIKTFGFLMFSGGSKGNIEKERVKELTEALHEVFFLFGQLNPFQPSVTFHIKTSHLI